MSASPLVSVLIPSYNYAKYVSNTIASVSSQTYENLEILVLDDGSTDGSFDLIQDLAKRDNRIKAWRQDNKGLIHSLNRLFELSRGKYIAQVDSDDMLLPNRIQWGVDELETDSEVSASFCSFVRMTADNELLGGITQFFIRAQQGQVLAQRLILSNFLCACTAFMRRESIISAGGFARDFSLVHDWDRWMRLSLHGALKLRTDIGAMHRIHGKNQSLNEEKSLRQQIAISDDITRKVFDHYKMREDIYAYVHGAQACRKIQLKEYAAAADHLAAKSLNAALEEQERMWLLRCFIEIGRMDSAKALLTLLQTVKNEMTASHQAELDRIGQLLVSPRQKSSFLSSINIQTA